MPCFSMTNTWCFTPSQPPKTLSEGFQAAAVPTQYVIQLNRQIDCCKEQYQILVNGQPIDHTLNWNMCSPLCCPGGEYGWEQDGHHFLLMYNGIQVLRSMRGFVLFVNGVDVDSGLPFKNFWRRQGFKYAGFGLGLLIVGAIISCVIYFAIDSTSYRSYQAGFGLMIAGVIFIFMGMIPVLRKYDSPRFYHGTVNVAGTTPYNC